LNGRTHDMSEDPKHEEMVQLIRRLAKEVAWEVIDEHLDDYEHKEKPAEDFEVECDQDE
jgi:hypothetical protein